MTCVVGYVKDGVVWMGADSAGSDGHRIQDRADSKVFVNGPFVMGFTSSFRMGQLLRYKLEVGEQNSRQTDIEYMSTTFIDEVRQCLKDGGFLHEENGEETGGSFMVGYRGQLYVIDSDFQVGQMRKRYHAIGSGEDFALAAMYTMVAVVKVPWYGEDMVKTAIGVADEFVTTVRLPAEVIEHTPGQEARG